MALGMDSKKRQTSADANGSPDQQLAALQSQLKEKDALVAALTERLEQAAEKLDRVHRSGGDRGLRMGAIPPELIDQQMKLTEELKQAVERWEDMQAGAVLGRIEVQITELRDLVANGLPAGGGGGGWPAPQGREAASGAAGRGESGGGSQGGGSGFSGWEALKAGLMKGEGAASTPQAQASRAPSAAPAPSGPAESAPAEDAVVINIEEVPPPDAIDPATADAEALRAAVERRDEYITYLTRKLRLANGRSIRLPDWEALNNAPEELVARLKDLEAQLDENLRLAEVELSLERARLAREAARLRLQQDQVEKELKRLKLDRPQGAATTAATHGGDPDNPTGRRWLRMLGMGKGGDEE
jgi:hypothetical protein